MFDYSKLKKAIRVFDKVYSLYINNSAENDVYEALKMAVVQAFEYTYELSWKYMRRWLADNYFNEVDDALSAKQLFRLAAKHGLIDSVDAWFNYKDIRNLSSHTYEEKNMTLVLNASETFLGDVKVLYERLVKNND